MFIKQSEANWDYILIVLAVSAAVGLGTLWPSGKQENNVAQLPKMKKAENVVKSETAGWPVYKNEDYGFELKYPKNWQQGPNVARPLPPHRVFCPPELSAESGGCKTTIQPTGFVSQSAVIFFFVEDWNKIRGDTKEAKKGIQWCDIEKKEIINGIEMEFVSCEGQKRAYWENPAGTHLYKLFLQNSDYQNEFQLMLSAFKFLK